jgi:hypothetical protein
MEHDLPEFLKCFAIHSSAFAQSVPLCRSLVTGFPDVETTDTISPFCGSSVDDDLYETTPRGRFVVFVVSVDVAELICFLMNDTIII